MQRSIVHIVSANDVFGPEKTTINECKALLKLGWNCKIVNIWSTSDIPFSGKVKAAGISYECIVTTKAFDINTIKSIKKICSDLTDSIIHSHGYKADIYTLLSTRSLKIARTTTIHGWTSEDFKVRIYEKLQAFSWRFFDRVFCVSKSYRDIAIKRGIPQKKLHMLHNGILIEEKTKESHNNESSFEQYPIKNDDVIIGIVGRLGIEKDHKLFLEIASQVSKSCDNVKYLIVGEGLEFNNLKEYTATLGLNGKVIFTGHLNNMDVVYKRMDIMVICSHREGLPNVLLEAMLNRVPVVSIDVGGIPEVIEDGISGVLIRNRVPASFSKPVIEFVEDKNKRAILGDAARKRIISAFTFENRMKNVIQHYESILN